MKKILWIGSLCVLTTALNAQNQPVAPSPSGTSDLAKRVQTLENKVAEIENKVKEVETLAKGTQDPLDKPVYKSEAVMDWVKANIVEIYSYNFANYKQVLANISRYFTPAGYDSYVKALQDSGNFSIMEEKKTLVTAMIVGDAKIVNEGIENNIYRWLVQVPLKVTYQEQKGSAQQEILANIEVVRVNDPKYPEGLAIHNITAQAKPTEEPSPQMPGNGNQPEGNPSQESQSLEGKPTEGLTNEKPIESPTENMPQNTEEPQLSIPAPEGR